MARRVPTIRDVVVGANVNIVLKQDQRTGREVSGTVQDVLTKGNHPRGIKVRLADGRVGRVQGMAPGGAPAPAVVPRSIAGADEDWGREWASSAGSGSGSQQPRPETQIGLDAYVKEAKPKKRGGGKSGQGESMGDSRTDAAEESNVGINADSGTSAETTTCPVCGDFEGDEAAVSHHVSSHFDS